MASDNTIVISKDGQQITCDIYFSFISPDTNKGYIVFTDHTLDENNKIRLYIKSYDPNDPDQNLCDVTQAEYEMANRVMVKLQSRL